jgi:hypothetical protein
MNSLANLLLSEECVEIMLTNKELFHVPCLQQLIAKLLSFGILAGSVLFKLPQVQHWISFTFYH